MPIPSYGASPLSATFLGVRIAQVAILIIILGMTGAFVNAMLMDETLARLNLGPSKEVVGTLVITALVTLYTLVSIAFYWSIAKLGLFVMAGVDFLILIAWIVVSVTIGRPISYLNCYHPPQGLNASQVLENIVKNAAHPNTPVDLYTWSGMTKGNCHETKAIWGFSIALAILYATSTVLLPTLHFKNKKSGGYAKYAV